MGFCLLVVTGAEKLLKTCAAATATGTSTLSSSASTSTTQCTITTSSCLQNLWSILLKVGLVGLVSSHGLKTVLRNQDWRNELSIFSSGISVNPSNAKLWNNVGHAYEAKEQYLKALMFFQKAAKVQPDDLGAHINVGRTHNNLGHFGQAEAAYLKAKAMMPQPKPGGQPYTARIAPQHLSVFLNLGNLIAKDPSRYQEADALYRRAISMRTDYIQAYINRGDVLIKMGRHDEASSVYRQALTFEPDNPDLHYNLGVVHIEMGRPSEALLHFDRALDLDPDHVQALTNSAVLMQETGRPELRPKAYQRLHKVLDKANKNSNKGRPHHSKVKGADTAKGGGGGNLERIYFNLGMLAMDDGDLGKAERWFKEAVGLKAGFRSALFNLALLLNDLKRPLEALPYLQDLLVDFTDHVKGLILLGDIYTNHVKDLKAAESCYRRIVAIDRQHVQGKHNLCVVMVEQGKLMEARQCLREAQVMAPGEAYIAKHLQIVESRIRLSAKRNNQASTGTTGPVADPTTTTSSSPADETTPYTTPPPS